MPFSAVYGLSDGCLMAVGVCPGMPVPARKHAIYRAFLAVDAPIACMPATKLYIQSLRKNDGLRAVLCFLWAV